MLLRRPIGLDLKPIYDKIVRRRRGGGCFELNGVMEWALREIGFDTVRISAGFMRVQAGDSQLGNHLCLLVSLDEPYLVDVGLGGSLSEPLPLRISERGDRPYRVSLSEPGDGYWRFAEEAHGDLSSFDFRVAPADEALLAWQCRFLQTESASPFTQNLIV